MLHNPSYDFNDQLIPLGGSMWVRLVAEWPGSEFPMTVTGKIQKFVMRERMIEEIDLNIERGPT